MTSCLSPPGLPTATAFFAVEKEHDQAILTYFKASQLMAGCHLPRLYIKLKYSLTNNTHLAEKFFSQKLEVEPDDPFVLHELSVTLWTLREGGEVPE